LQLRILYLLNAIEVLDDRWIAPDDCGSRYL
jgi:hypothetical protein